MRPERLEGQISDLWIRPCNRDNLDAVLETRSDRVIIRAQWSGSQCYRLTLSVTDRLSY